MGRRAQKALGVLRKVAVAAGLGTLFAAASTLALVIYADLPAGRRFLAAAFSQLLSQEFEGTFSVSAVDHISPTEFVAREVVVRDAAGRIVLKLSGLSARGDLFEVGKTLLFGGSKRTLIVAHARVERAEAYLLPEPGSSLPSIARAFTRKHALLPTAPTANPSALRAWLPAIEVGRAFVRGTISRLPTFEAEFTSVHGSLLATAKGVAIDVDRFASVIRGFGGTDARGVGSLHVRAPGAVWTSFNGYFGEMEFGALVRLDGERVRVTCDVPGARAADVRAVWRPFPVLVDTRAHLEASGTLEHLDTSARAEVGVSSVVAHGDVRLTGKPGADLNVTAHALDLRSFWSAAPATELDLEAVLAILPQGSDALLNVTGTSQPMLRRGSEIPAVDVRGSYGAKGFLGHATVHERGAPIEVEFAVNPEGAIDLDAKTENVELAAATRLAPYIAARGRTTLRATGRIEQGRLDARVSGDVRNFGVDALSLATAKVTGHVVGPVSTPEELELDFSVDAKSIGLGPLAFEQGRAQLNGRSARPTLSVSLESASGPHVTAKAAIATRAGMRIEGLELGVERDGAALRGRVARLEITGGRVLAQNFSLEGDAGTLSGSADLAPGQFSLTAHAKGLDLDRVSQVLGLPRGTWSGKLDADTELAASARSQKGHLELSLEQGELKGFPLTSLTVRAALEGPALDIAAQTSVTGLGDFSARGQARLGGNVTDARSWRKAVGKLALGADHVLLDRLAERVVPGKNSTIVGQASGTLELERADPGAFPDASLHLKTTSLALTLPGTLSGRPLATAGVDAELGARVSGASGDSEATVVLTDAHGTLASLALNTRLDLDAAEREPRSVLEQLYTHPLLAKLVVDDRELEELPALVAPTGISGRVRAELSLRGSAREPILSLKTTIGRLRLDSSATEASVDVCGQLDYDKSSGRMGARAEVFLPDPRLRTCSGGRVAQVSAGGTADWQRFFAPELSPEPAWTGSAGLLLEGVPIEEIPGFAEARVKGRVFGAVMLERRQALPQMSARLEVREATVDRTRLGTAQITLHTDGTAFNADLQLSEPHGTLAAELNAALDWQSLIPHLDDTRPVHVAVDARAVDAVILTPFVRDVLSEVGGKLDAHLETTLTPRLGGEHEQHFTAATNGTLSLSQGKLRLARIGLGLEDVKFEARAEGTGQDTLVSIGPVSARAASAQPNVAGQANLRLDGLRVERANASITIQRLPLLIEGVTLATLSGSDLRVDLERRPNEIFVAFTVPELEAELPRAASRELLPLAPNADILVLQPLGEGLNGGDSTALPWRVQLALGDGVKVTRSDLFLPITGSPELRFGQEFDLAGSVELLPGGRLDVPGLGRTFTIDRGEVHFDTGDAKNPRLNVTAFWRAPEVTIYVDVTGTFKKAQLRFRSDPPLPGGDADIQALLLGGGPSTEGGAAASGIGAGANFLGQQLLSGTPLGRLEFKTASETSADQRAYSTFTAAYPITDELWFEGSYKSLQTQDPTEQNNTAFSGTFDWRFKRAWSLRTELGNTSAGMDLLWQYRY